MTRPLLLLLASICAAFGQRQVAITIDDLPLGGAPPHNCEAAALGKLQQGPMSQIGQVI